MLEKVQWDLTKLEFVFPQPMKVLELQFFLQWSSIPAVLWESNKKSCTCHSPLLQRHTIALPCLKDGTSFWGNFLSFLVCLNYGSMRIHAMKTSKHFLTPRFHLLIQIRESSQGDPQLECFSQSSMHMSHRWWERVNIQILGREASRIQASVHKIQYNIDKRDGTRDWYLHINSI